MIERDSKYCIVGEAWQFSKKDAGYYLAPYDFASKVENRKVLESQLI